ncbi:methionine--tRNA ligase [Brachyspira aalborgi]|uniref:Methionine--tRNA ligase n=1 Tax=Brachyspira aalborgi TaxID=29522 RepID=A0A5C8GHI1_9SPIR|nr:methionine--tRNA ligase [Brachyspira aalborgi]TXJ60648.1 methionine--tRNA ligase [Brachyspira aalborgi]
MTDKKFYITTPIYYPSDYLHIGHCYCTIAADTMARYKRITGYDVYFLTGTDEHGEKIERKAEAAKTTPKAYVDNIVQATKELWKRLHIDYTHYIRTTDDYHERRVQKIFQKLYDKNFIYKGLYKGLYCVSDEAFFTDSQVIKKEDGKCYCPDCEKELEYKEEECYYLKLSDYGQWLIDYYKEHPEFLGPKERMNEMLNNFLLPGLEDLAVTRKGLKWGIPCPINKEHSIYVWIDALSNYITALGYPEEEDDLFKKYWACDVHFVGKEIVRFHSIIWPIMLKMLDIPLPKKVFGHGWILFDDGKKMSKSRGNVVEPNSLIDKYGVDSLRYFLMREITFGIDGYYSQELLLKRINSDLANDYGNLWHRITTMLGKYFNSILPEEVESVYGERERELKKAVLTLDANVESALDDFKFNEALSYIWEVIRMTNKYVEESAPWNLAKDETKKDYLANVMYISFQSYYIITAYLQIFFVETPKKVFNRLGLGDNVPLEDAKKWGSLNAGIKIERGEALFKRYDIEEEIGIKTKENKKEVNPPKDEKHKPNIEKEEFEKLELLTAKIIFAEKVENADKLIKFVVDIGAGEQRVVVSSIAEYYKAEDMVGKTVLYLANLKPKKFRGIMSHGMLLLADNGETLSIMKAEKDFEAGCEVK